MSVITEEQIKCLKQEDFTPAQWRLIKWQTVSLRTVMFWLRQSRQEKKKLKQTPLILAVAFLCLCGWTNASPYYVSPSGNDTNDGLSPQTPWATVNAVNAHAFTPGDTVLFESGQVFYGGISLTTSGLAGAPITFDSYGTGVATISSSAERGFFGHNCGYIVIQNLNFAGVGLSEGIKFQADAPNSTFQFIRIENVNVGAYTNGIEIRGAATSGYSDVQITNSTAYNNTLYGGILVWTGSGGPANIAHSNIYVGHCTAYGNTGKAGLSNWSGSGIFVSRTRGATIEYCAAYNNGAGNNYPGGGPVGIWTGLSSNVTIQFCESYDNKSQTVDGGGFDIDGGCNSCVIGQCYSHGNKGAGYLLYQYSGAAPWTNNIVQNCVSEGDGYGIRLGGQIAGATISGNTVRKSAVHVLDFIPGSTDVLISNNTFYIP